MYSAAMDDSDGTATYSVTSIKNVGVLFDCLVLCEVCLQSSSFQETNICTTFLCADML